MNILLTGATGYVGRNLISHLINSSNHKLFAITRREVDLDEKVVVIKDDDHLEDEIIKLQPDIVIHLASYLTARSEVNDIHQLIDANITFGTLLLNALQRVKIKCFINVGSFSEYHFSDGNLNPTYLYAATKTAFRSILNYYSALSGFKVVHVVPYTIYGGQDSQKKIIDILFDAVNTTEPLKISEGLQNLDFIYISDLVIFFRKLIDGFEKIDHNDVLHVGTGKVHNLRDVAKKIEEITNSPLRLNWGAYPPRVRDTVYANAPIGKLKILLNWEPEVTLEEGLNLKYKQIQNEYSKH